MFIGKTFFLYSFPAVVYSPKGYTTKGRVLGTGIFRKIDQGKEEPLHDTKRKRVFKDLWKSLGEQKKECAEDEGKAHSFK